MLLTPEALNEAGGTAPIASSKCTNQFNRHRNVYIDIFFLREVASWREVDERCTFDPAGRRIPAHFVSSPAHFLCI